LFAVASAQNDSIATADLNIGNVILGQQKCALKNLTIIDPVAPPLMIPLDIWWTRARGRHWIGTDRAGKGGLKGVILGSRLVRYAKERKIKSRKTTADERKQIQLLLRDNRKVPPDLFDLENVYAPAVGPWLLADPPQGQQPDRIIALLNRPIRDRFAIVQWDEQGFPVGGFTFEPARAPGRGGGHGAPRTSKARSSATRAAKSQSVKPRSAKSKPAKRRTRK
jgi:hypothetical protein